MNFKKQQKKLKILQVTLDLGISGLPKLVVDICKNLNKTIFDVSVFCFKKCEEEFTPELKKNNILVYIPFRKNPNKPDYLNFLKLYRFIERNKFDIIHTHNTAAFIDGVIASKMAGVPVIIHTDHARAFPDKKRYMLAEWFLSRFTTKIVAVSEHTRSKLIEYEKLSPSKVIVIPNGIDERKYAVTADHRKKKELGIEKHYPILGLGVRLIEQKGVEYLLKAMPSILQEFPKTMLLIAGGGPFQQNLQTMSEKLGIAQAVKFLGFRLDMPEILSILDIYVLPSIWEGMPLVILEAMAAKKPIVATKVGGIPEAVIHNHSGLLVPPKDPEALANAILKILKNSNLAASLAENAYNRFLKYFTVKKMVSRYEQLYLNCYFKKYPCQRVNVLTCKRVNLQTF